MSANNKIGTACYLLLDRCKLLWKIWVALILDPIPQDQSLDLTPLQDPDPDHILEKNVTGTCFSFYMLTQLSCFLEELQNTA